MCEQRFSQEKIRPRQCAKAFSKNFWFHTSTNFVWFEKANFRFPVMYKCLEKEMCGAKSRWMRGCLRAMILCLGRCSGSGDKAAPRGLCNRHLRGWWPNTWVDFSLPIYAAWKVFLQTPGNIKICAGARKTNRPVDVFVAFAWNIFLKNKPSTQHEIHNAPGGAYQQWMKREKFLVKSINCQKSSRKPDWSECSRLWWLSG